jgi:hypothetical protein
MAVISPEGLVAARSPLLITWNGTGTSASDINYFNLEIYVWSGEEASKPASPVYTINRTSGFVDSYPTADISALIENEFNNRISKLWNDAIVFQSPDSHLFVQVDYDIEYIDPSGPFVVNDTGSTDIFIVTYGYGKFIEGANPKIQGPLLQEKDRYAYDKDAWMLPIYLGLHGEGLDIIYGYRDRVVADGGTIESLSCANIGLANIRVLNDDGTKYQYAVTEADVYETKAEERVLLFPSGIANLSNWKVNQGYGSTAPYNTKYYDIQLLDGFNSIIDSIRVYNECEPKYDPVSLYFVNRYGAWDYITFLKRSDKDLTLEKETYQSVIGSASASGYTWGNQARGLRSYNHKVTHNMTLNTGFVSEDYGEVMEQLLMSEYVLMIYNRTTTQSGSGYDISQDQRAVNIVTNSLRLQKHINDKTINYTIDIEMANPENAML